MLLPSGDYAGLAVIFVWTIAACLFFWHRGLFEALGLAGLVVLLAYAGARPRAEKAEQLRLIINAVPPARLRRFFQNVDYRLF